MRLGAAALLSLIAGTALLIPLILVSAAIGTALVPLGRWRPERIAMVLAVVVVAGGAVAASVRVADGVADSRIQYRGELDVRQILSTFNPTGPAGVDDPVPAIRRLGYGYLHSAEGVITKPRSGTRALVLWSMQELAPWVLASIVLVLLFPALRAAERGDPFTAGAARTLAGIGALLLVGIPAIAILRFVAAEATSEGRFAGPMADATLTLSVSDVLPGLLVLFLAGVFRRGVELREFERHAI